jgi:hypothetical protein
MKFLALSLTILLTACGGGGTGNSPIPTSVPIPTPAPSPAPAVSTTPKVAFQVIAQNTQDHNKVSNYAVGDLNGDGLDDVVVGGWTGKGVSYLSILLQNADGTLTDRTNELAGSNQYPGSGHVFIGDFDHDGYADIWLPGGDDLIASIPSMMLWGSATGKFTRQTIDSGVSSAGACLADLNNDGRLDLLIKGTYNHDTNTYGYYLNNGDRTFSTLVPNQWVNGASACAVVRDSDTGHFAVFQGNTNQLAGYASSISIVDANQNLIKQIGIFKQDASMAGINSAVAMDVNGDGLLDFVINYEAWAPGAPGRKEVWLNQGHDNFVYAYALDTSRNATNIMTFEHQGNQYCFFEAPNGDAVLYQRVNGQLVLYQNDRFMAMAVALGARAGAKDWSIESATVYSGTAGLYMLQNINGKYYTQKM